MIAKMLLIVVAEPLLLLALVLGIRKTPLNRRVACGIIAVVSIASVFLEVPALAGQGVVTLLGIFIFARARGKSKFVLAIVGAPLIAIYALAVVVLTGCEASDLLFAQGLVSRISKLRAEYPLQSVADRLAYESKLSGSGADAESDSSIPQLNPDAERRLAATEQRRTEADEKDWRQRRMILASLHTQTNDEFVQASGFGRRRIIDPGAKSYAARLELPEIGPISVEPEFDKSYDPEHESATPLMEAGLANQHLPAKDDLLSMHDAGIEDFVDPDRIGFVKDRDHVAGFKPHRFTKMPKLAVPTAEPHGQWQVIRLELVSLLKHDTPVAYVSKNLPQMDELGEAAIRPLDPFERKSLDRLRFDEDVVIDETPDRIQMLGSLRAAKNCLACHSVRRGELLGALTYELVPVRPTRKKGPEEPTIN